MTQTKMQSLYARTGVFKVKKITNKVVIADLLFLKEDETPLCAYNLNYILFYNIRQKQNLSLKPNELFFASIKEIIEDEKTGYLEVREEEPVHGIYLAYCKDCNAVLSKPKKYQEVTCLTCETTNVRKYSILYNTVIF